MLTIQYWHTVLVGYFQRAIPGLVAVYRILPTGCPERRQDL